MVRLVGVGPAARLEERMCVHWVTGRVDEGVAGKPAVQSCIIKGRECGPRLCWGCTACWASVGCDTPSWLQACMLMLPAQHLLCESHGVHICWGEEGSAAALPQGCLGGCCSCVCTVWRVLQC